MIKQASSNLAKYANVRLVKGEGSNLTPIESNSVDLVYSFVVFQHITKKHLTKSYFADTSRVLKSGGRFLFQVRDYNISSISNDVWHGSDVSENDIRAWAAEFGFNVDRVIGQQSHYQWACLTRL
jgi:ubiquinone/menaquinone biosynthesis C-methylase UbiE